MPIFVVTDWVNGPMGPGWFVKFPRHRDVWYDGGPPVNLTEDSLGGEDYEKDSEMVALILLMLRCRC